MLLLEIAHLFLGHWTGRKGLGYPFRDDSPFGLSTSHTITDPSFNYSGMRKIKVNKWGSDNGIPEGTW